MSSLLPNHHRSTSDRLLNNYLSSQKQLTTALLTLLSHSHSSTSSLLAYVTSSSGVAYPVRRSVQHAGFEGPMNQDNGNDYDSINGNASEAKWHEYIASLEHFRKELKDVHMLEEELSQVKKDREILVSRLIKATKSRPTKADIAAAAKAGSENGRSRPSNSSVLSFGSDHSNTTAGGGKSKRAEKLAEAQAEVLGCEEHLRGLEVRLEQERNKVMKHGLMERFRAMQDVGRMWQRQARLGMAELESSNGGHDGHMLHSNAYEVESNGSIAPSQSASQVGYNSDGEQERRQRSHGRGAHAVGVPGSVTGSIAEEDENSSSDDDENLVVHENKRPGVGTGGNDLRSRSQTTIVPSGNQNNGQGQGVPSITNIKAKPANRRQNSGSSGSSAGRGPGRRTQSELGYNPPRARQNRLSIRRAPSRGAMSDGSSDRSVRRGGGKKKGGFFASIAKIFKGKSSNGSVAGSTRGGRRDRADSPPLTQRNTGGWSTRTDDNIRRAVSGAGTGRGLTGGRKSRNADYSSSDDEMGGGNLVAVTNRGNNTWSVDNAGRQNGAVGATPAAASTGKSRKSRSDLGAGEKGRTSSQNTITQAAGKVTSKPPGVASQSVSRSNTVKSTTSGVGAGSQRTRHGSITRVGARGSTMGAPPSIAGVLGEVVPKAPSSATAGSKPTPNRNSEVPKAPGSSIVPKMADIPKAPGSQVTPQMYMATAPPPNKAPLLQPPPAKMSGSASAPVGLSGDGYVPKAAASSTSKMSKASKATITPKTAQQTQPQQQQTQPQQQQAPPQAAQAPKSSSALADLNLGAPVGMSQPNESVDSIIARSHTPLPPSKTLSPPAKSAMRSHSPMPPSSPEFEAPPPAFMISAPGSVIKEKPKEEQAPVVLPEATVPAPQPQARAERPSTPQTMTDADSVYESAVEEEGNTDDERRARTSQAVTSNGDAQDDDDGSSIMSDSTAGPGAGSKYKVVENTDGPAARLRQAATTSEAPVTEAAAPVENVTAPAPAAAQPKEVVKDDFVPAAAASVTGSALERRKSVRMNVPPSPSTPNTIAPPDSPTPESKRDSTTWSSKVGRTVDSSDEEDNAAYAKARRNMNRYSSLSASQPKATTTSSSTTTKKKKRSSTKA